MSPEVWAQLHGATTHFPIALALSAVACDAAALCLWQRPLAERLHFAGKLALAAAALACLPVIVSGLLMTRGGLWGAGALRSHHAFAWPAFALVIVLATWRALVGAAISRRAFALYLAALGGLAALLAAAGYWGGELLQRFP